MRVVAMRLPTSLPIRFGVIAAAILSFATALAAAAAPRDPLAATPIVPREYVIDQWQTEDGLPQNSVTDIAQTPDGYLWMGTFNGLVRFDGLRFTIYQNETTPELPSSRIVQLSADPDGRLWILSEFGHLTTFSEGRFTNITDNAGRVESFVSDAEARVWLQTPSGIRQAETGSISPTSALGPAALGRIKHSVRDADGTFWLARKFGFGLSDGATFSQIPGSAECETGDRFTQSADGAMWVAMNGCGLAKYRRGERIIPFEAFPLSTSATRDLLEDSRGNVWVGSSGQGVFHRAPGGAWSRISTTEGLSHDDIRTIFEDREGNIWIGTDGGGLNRLKRPLVQIVSPRDDRQGNVVRSITQNARGETWIALNQRGVYRIRDGYALPVIAPPLLHDASSASPLLADNSGAVWAPDEYGGLLALRDGQPEPHPNPSISRRVYVNALFQDRAGAIWAGDTVGITRFHNGQFTNFPVPGLTNADVRAFAETAVGDLFIGLNGGGLARLRDGKMERFTQANGLPDDRVWSLFVDSDQTLWIGSFGGGLSRFKDNKFASIGTRLPIKFVNAMLEDSEGRLWISSMNGIFAVSRAALNQAAEGEPSEVPARHFDRSDGMLSAECAAGLQPLAWKGADGKLWFATIKGAAVIDPSTLPFNPVPPRAIIERARLDMPNEPSQWHDLQPGAAPAAIRVPAGAQRVEFHYTALSFTSPEKIQFRYRLEGLDKQWINAGAERVAHFSHLPPGDFTFRVLARNSDGVWNQTGAALPVTVLPFFWQTIWFQAIALSSIAGALIIAFRWRIGQIERQRAQEQAFSRLLINSQEQERKRIAGDLHDSLGQNLLIMKNSALLGLDRKGTHEEAFQFFEQISSAASLSLEEVRALAYKLRPYQLDQLGLTKAIQSLVSLVHSASGIKLSANIGRVDRIFPPDDEIHVFRIIQESLNNLIKHSGARSAALAVRLDERNFLFSLEDDGHGFDTREIGVGGSRGNFGISGMRERVKLLGGEFAVASAPGRGTVLSVTIPVQNPSNVS